MTFLQSIFGFIGRAFLSLIFILSGLHKIFNWQKAEEDLVDMIAKMMTNYATYPEVQNILHSMMTWISVLLILVIFLELVGGIFIFFGIHIRLGAFFLILFLVPVTLLCHPFWEMDGVEKNTQMVMCLKNLAILGGVIQLLAYGGRKSSPNPGPKKG